LEADVSVTKPTGATSDQIAGVMKLYVAVPARVDLSRVPAAPGLPDTIERIDIGKR
jgi:hypothetical protein